MFIFHKAKHSKLVINKFSKQTGTSTSKWSSNSKKIVEQKTCPNLYANMGKEGSPYANGYSSPQIHGTSEVLAISPIIHPSLYPQITNNIKYYLVDKSTPAI